MKSVTQHTKESSEKTVLHDSARGLTTVSVVIPTYNEEKYISQCLDSIIADDFPKNMLEILVIDGMSTDRTREIVKQFSQDYPYIRLIDNPNRFTPFAFNLGIKNAQNEIIVIMGAHSTYSKDYISKCVYYLNEYEADNVGGTMITLSQDDTFIGNVISTTISHPFGVGNSSFRTGVKKPTWVDTVFGGCYRRDVFNKIGYFNEKLISSQDMDFNIRLKKAGGKILLVPSIVSFYFTRSDFKSFTRNNFRNGMWAILPIKYAKQPLAVRHFIPLFFVLGILTLIVLSIFIPFFWGLFLFFAFLYFIVSEYHAINISRKKRNFRYTFIMPLMFFSLHFIYGWGSLKAVFMMFKKGSSL